MALRPQGFSLGALSRLKWLQMDLHRPRAASLLPCAVPGKEGFMLDGPARAVDLKKGAWLFGRGSRERSSVYWLLALMAILPNIVALWVSF